MDTDEVSTRKRVSLSEIKPGMYVVGFDRSWLETPFFFHRKLIRNTEEIELLKDYGIREVVIDTARGADVEGIRPEPPPVTLARAATKNKAAPGTIPKTRSASLSETAFRPLAKELHVARRIHDQAVTTAQSVFEGIGRRSYVSSPAVKKVVTDLLGSITRSPEANLFLTQMHRFQDDLFTHSLNVCVLSLVVGTLENLESEISALGLGALLHDVGQTRIPRNLLRKQGRYTEPERELIEQHPRLGAILLKQSENIPEIAQRIAIEHHERIDGSGYPCGIRGAQISLLSQIVGITDTYDLLLTGRKQAALQPIEVLREWYLQANAGAFDPDLIERIIRCLGVYPIGSLVEVNTGERGIVIAANRADSLRPTLRIISSRGGRAESNGGVISLTDRDFGSVDRRIVRALHPAKERVDLMAYLKPSPALPGVTQ